MPHLIFDIETAPDGAGLRRLLRGHLADEALSQLSDEEVQKAFWAMRKPDESPDYYQKAFLPIHLHRVIVIGCALFEDDWHNFKLWSISSAGHESPPAEDEANILQRFFDGINHKAPQLVSWNGSGFDLPVLHHRAMIHATRAGRYWELGDGVSSFRYNNYINRYHFRHLDLMDVLSAYNGKNFARLDDMARLCGAPGKMGMEGAQVAGAFAQGRIHDISQYCQADVLNTALMYLRFLLMSERIDSAAHATAISSMNQWLTKQTDDFWQGVMV